MYVNECEKGRVKPHKILVDSTLKGKNKIVQSIVKQLPVLNICGVSGCENCKSIYKTSVEMLVQAGATSVLLYRVSEPEVKIWIYKEK